MLGWDPATAAHSLGLGYMRRRTALYAVFVAGCAHRPLAGGSAATRECYAGTGEETDRGPPAVKERQALRAQSGSQTNRFEVVLARDYDPEANVLRETRTKSNAAVAAPIDEWFELAIHGNTFKLTEGGGEVPYTPTGTGKLVGPPRRSTAWHWDDAAQTIDVTLEGDMLHTRNERRDQSFSHEDLTRIPCADFDERRAKLLPSY